MCVLVSCLFCVDLCVFSQGSVMVTFELWFNQLIGVKKVEQQLQKALQDSRGLVVDRNSIQITGKDTGQRSDHS